MLHNFVNILHDSHFFGIALAKKTRRDTSGCQVCGRREACVTMYGQQYRIHSATVHSPNAFVSVLVLQGSIRCIGSIV